MLIDHTGSPSVPLLVLLSARVSSLRGDSLAAALSALALQGHEKTLGARVLGRGSHSLRVTELDEFAVVHHCDAMADGANYCEAVRDEQVRDSGRFLHLEEQIEDRRLGGEVECGDLLVTHDELW